MSRPSWRAWAGLALLGALAWAAGGGEPRALLVAVEADAFSRLPGGGADAPWERLKAMGVGAALLREETVADLAARGEVLHFTRVEVEKWRALGVVSPAAGPGPDSLWARDAAAYARLATALAAAGVEASTSPAGSGRSFVLPPGTDLARVPAGFDPPALAAVTAAGLVPVAAAAGPVVPVAGHAFHARGVRVDARRPVLLRAAHGRPKRLLVFRPRADLDLEGNLTLLREALRVLREAGLSSAVPAPAPSPAPARVPPLGAAAFFLAGLAGPLLAARVALSAERAARAWTAARLPPAAPVPQVLAGVTAAWAAATAAGLVAAALLPEAARQELSRPWSVWALFAPVAVGAAALYSGGGERARSWWSRALRPSALMGILLLALALSLLLAPRAVLQAAGAWDALGRLGAWADRLWWWPWRWREAVIGVPALVVALTLAARGSDPAASREGFLSDPRPWLVLGLLGPAGAMAATAAGAVPPLAAAAQGAVAAAMGAALGLALAFLRARIEAWVLGPKTIGPLT